MTALFVGVDVAKSTLEACKFVAGRFHHLKFRNLPYGFQALVDWMGLHFEPQDIFLVVVLMLVNLSDAQVAPKRFDTLSLLESGLMVSSQEQLFEEQ